MVPHCFRFNPTDEELIQILHRKASGQEIPLHFIVQTNFYDLDPQDLEWNPTAAISNGERYFFYCKRENESREVAGRGWWKATSHVKKVYVGELLVGCKRPLTFHRYKDHQRSRISAIKTNWILHEYSLETMTTEWRLCKIRHKGKPISLQEEMDAPIRQSTLSNHLEASSSNINLSSDSTTKQASNEENVVASASSDYNVHQLPAHNYEHWNYINPQQPYDPNRYYNVDDQPEQSETTEWPFPCLWSWHN